MIHPDQILDFILTFQKAYPGVSPSYRDIQVKFGLSSTSTVAKYIEELSADDVLQPFSDHVRGLVLSETALLTRQELEQLGIDWSFAQSLRSQSRNELENEYGYAAAGR